METYRDLNGTSGVLAYQLGVDHIIVQFKTGRHTFYKYTSFSAGSMAIEMLKRLARQGFGLNSYISTHDPGYSSKASSLTSLF